MKSCSNLEGNTGNLARQIHTIVLSANRTKPGLNCFGFTLMTISTCKTWLFASTRAGCGFCSLICCC